MPGANRAVCFDHRCRNCVRPMPRIKTPSARGCRIASALALAVPSVPSLLLTTTSALAVCTVNTATMTCTGDESTGIVVDRDDFNPPVQIIEIDQLTNTIGGSGVQLSGNGSNGNDGDSAVGTGDDGDDGGDALDLTIDYTDPNFGVSTTSDEAGGLFVGSKAGDGGKGGTGDNDAIDPVDTKGGKGGTGGTGGNVTVESTATINTTGNLSHGILAVSDGGDGGDGGHAQSAIDSNGGNGGAGGPSGQITITSTGPSITTSGPQAQGIYAQSLGGAGGNGGTSDGGIAGGGGGGAGGGIAKAVIIVNDSTIETSGNGAGGILAQSIGGFAGSGGGGSDLFSFGASGESGGPADAVSITNRGAITTQGTYATAIMAQSTGGGGGSANTDGGVVSLGGSGDSGGDAGTVFVQNLAVLTTNDDNSVGIQAQSVGGGGGDAGDSGGLVSIGAGGGNGGNGGRVLVENHAGISTVGEASDAILAHSVGGGGGNGGSGGGLLTAVGGNGGSGGRGEAVFVYNTSDLSTQGDHSNGILAESIGGGGGKGGNTVDVGVFVSVGVGGTGGNGGDGSIVEVNTDVSETSVGRSISTQGDHSGGIVAHSVGGSGGKGGWTVSASAGMDADVSIGVGGSGANGGSGREVTVHNKGTIATVGKFSDGIMAQSSGGGGGMGGFAVSAAVSEATSISVGVGGGGGGGDAGRVSVKSWTDISTDGDHSNGIVAESIGGSGGHGGFSMSLSGSFDTSVGLSVGGDGGSGGDASSSHLESVGHITTDGDHAAAILVQSIGGGGGNGGFSLDLAASSTFTVSVAVGGKSGSGGSAGDVMATSSGNLVTTGIHSNGLAAQSIGGGGGNGGYSVSLTGTGEGAGVPVSIGGDGSTGGTSGAVTAINRGNITTEGSISYGILAQSLGGGGGNGGFSASGSVTLGEGATVPVSVGGGGGTGHHARSVTVDSVGNIRTGTETTGRHSGGILAQSIGGGGGNGGFSISAGIVSGGDGGSLSVAVGGKGGSGSFGGAVSITSIGDIESVRSGAPGIRGQSIGGGGGSGGFSASFDGSESGDLSVSIGGEGGAGNHGSAVTIQSKGTIITGGRQSYGISAQSIGGGGGHGGFSLAGSISEGDNVSVAIGGKGGGGGNGGEVTVFHEGSIRTAGSSATGLLAQSVGNSGGTGGFSGTLNIALDEGGNVGVSVGGGGGVGGFARAVTVTAIAGEIRTGGRGASGILAQSVGGSGGNGGFGFTGNLGTGESSGNIGVTVGGGGGDGGASGAVSVANASAIHTREEQAHAIQAQSTAGSGGNGGMALTANLSLDSDSPGNNLGVSVSGAGGRGNIAGKVTIDNAGALHTEGFKARGLFAQSIGGGGGDGGLSFSGNFAGGQDSKEMNVAVGGGGGSGNNAAAVTVINDGSIATESHFSEAILAQSIGGGGGTGGSASTAALSRQGDGTSLDFGVSIGGSGGAAGDGRAVDVVNNGTIVTDGVASTAINAQSIGGGGGKGGSSLAGIAGLTQSGTQPNPRTVNVNVAIGGAGGSGGNAGAVKVVNTGGIQTGDGAAKGISAQSIGGGGGQGGAADAFAMLAGYCAICGQSEPNNGAKSINLTVSIGGGGGGGGHADAVNVDNIGSILTEGAGADGIFAQSIGGGGGEGGTGSLGQNFLQGLAGVIISDGPIILDPVGSLKIWDDIQVAIGGSGGSAGNGGPVTVKNAGTIATLGVQSSAIYAQSIGGGGGRGGASSGGAFAIASIGGKGGSGGDAKAVTVENDGDIFTTGAASMGIFAQSVGGGGGHGGDVSQNLFWNGVDVGIGIDLSLGGGSGGNAGDVSVENTGRIVTEGAGGHGIFAHSVGGGGGVAGSAGVSPGSALYFIGSTGDDGDAGTVTVTTSGDIYTMGPGAVGIFAQSGSGQEDTDTSNDFANGASGTGKAVTVTVSARVEAAGENSGGVLAQSIGVNNNSDVTVSVAASGAVIGGIDTDGDGTDSNAIAIELLDGADNVVTNRGIVSTQQGHLGTAIATRTTRENKTTPNDTVDNYDILTGSVFLTGSTNAVTNYAGGRMNAGADIDIGSGNTVSNFGTISPGDQDQVFTSTITGDYVQSDDGTYEVDVDFKIADENPGPGVPGEADLIHITGTAELDGFVTVNAVNGAYLEPDVSGSVLILTADGEYGTPTLIAPDTAVVNYELSYDTTTTNNVYLGWTVNFTPDGLNRNETAIGDYITDVIAAGDPESLTPVVNALLEAPDIPTLRNYYDQLSSEAYIDNELATVLGNMRFARSLMNCHTMDETGHCGWLRFGGYRTERDETFEYFGFNENVLDGEAGIGGMVNDSTGLFLALNYGRSDIDTEDLASSDGHRLQGGLGLSHYGEGGGAISIAAMGGAAWYDVERTLTLTGTPMTAEGNQKLYFGGGQVRLSYEASNGPLTLTPSVEAWGGYFYNSAISESGAGGASLDIEGDGDFFAAVRPALKLAAQSTTDDGGTISAFIQGGATYIAYGNNNFGTGMTATMQGDANAVPGFTVTSSLADWYVDGLVGLNWTAPSGTQFKLSGGAQYAQDYLIYGGDAELVVPF